MKANVRVAHYNPSRSESETQYNNWGYHNFAWTASICSYIILALNSSGRDVSSNKLADSLYHWLHATHPCINALQCLGICP